MRSVEQRVRLIRYTENAEQLVAMASRLCYSPLSIDALEGRTQAEDQAAFLGGVIASGHHSVMEHASFTFAAEGVSRTLLAEITRHRIASFSVQSQRYVSKADGFDYITPPSIRALGPDAVEEYDRQMRMIHGWYVNWQQRLGGAAEASNQDARFVLPGACETRMVITMNARELLHFFALRGCERAQWEIRGLAREMLRLSYAVCPSLFQHAGPGCVTGSCPEGKRSCGRKEIVRQDIARLKERGNDRAKP